MCNLIEKLYLKQKYNLAFYDSLTRIFNRNWLEYYAKNFYRKKDIYIALVDLDGLKKINDTQGHTAGDDYIISLVICLQSVLPKADLCRLGGDEFLIFSDKDPKEELEKLLQIKNFSYGVSHKNAKMDISVCIKEADLLMYQMKEERKARN